jgi:hypothetical protein
MPSQRNKLKNLMCFRATKISESTDDYVYFLSTVVRTVIVMPVKLIKKQ